MSSPETLSATSQTTLTATAALTTASSVATNTESTSAPTASSTTGSGPVGTATADQPTTTQSSQIVESSSQTTSTSTTRPTAGQPTSTTSPQVSQNQKPTGTPRPTKAPTPAATAPISSHKPTSPPTPTPTATPVPTRPPLLVASPTPTAAPTATPAATASFPATNYGSFFRDQYGGNSQVTKSDDGTVLIDTGSTANGVVLIRIDGIPASKQVKAIVVANNNTYQYDIVDRGRYVGLPLQLGNGNYTLTVYEQVAGTSYVAVMALGFSVNLSSSLKPYTAASIISDFSRSSKAVAQAASLCKGISSQDGKVNAVYNWIASNISYDTALANNIIKNKSLYEAYLPDPDKTMSSRKGICFDYASLMCAMLRSQGIPTRLVKGSTPLGYHAWNEVYFKGKGWVVIANFRLAEIDGSSWVLLDTTWAAAGWSPEKIKNTTHNKQRVY